MDSYALIRLLNVVAFLWITFCLARVLLGTTFTKGNVSSNDIALIVFWVFYAVPLVILATYENGPNYFAPMLSTATRSTQTAWIQTLYLMSVGSALTLTRKPFAPKAIRLGLIREDKGVTNYLQPIIFGLLIACVYLVVNSPEPAAYLEYGFFSRAQTRHLVSHDMAMRHTLITTFANLCIICSGALLLARLDQKNILVLVFAYIPVVSLAAWFNGKRNAVAISVFFILLAIAFKKNISTSLKVLLVLFLLSVFGCYSSWYQSQRGLAGVGTVESYLGNYGRDHCLRLAIFTELNGDNILEYRGQSFLFDLLMFVPRSSWPAKPWPYATYFTSKAFGNHKLHVYGWQLTTGIFDECISNFGWLGLFIGPLIVLCLCRLNDKEPRLIVRVGGYLVIALMQLVHLPAFYPIFLLWFTLVLQKFLYPIKTSSNSESMHF